MNQSHKFENPVRFTSEKFSLRAALVERDEVAVGIELGRLFVDLDTASVQPTLHGQALHTRGSPVILKNLKKSLVNPIYTILLATVKWTTV